MEGVQEHLKRIRDNLLTYTLERQTLRKILASAKSMDVGCKYEEVLIIATYIEQNTNNKDKMYLDFLATIIYLVEPFDAVEDFKEEGMSDDKYVISELVLGYPEIFNIEESKLGETSLFK